MKTINWRTVALTLIRYLTNRDKANVATVLRRAGLSELIVPLAREVVFDRKIREFHRQRMIFIALPTDGKDWPTETAYHVHMPADCTLHIHWNYEGSHEEWVEEMIGVPWEEAKWCVRGFYWEPTNSVYFYHGNGTESYSACEDWFFRNKNYVMGVLQEGGCNLDTKIFAGMKPGEPGTLWEPIKSYGTFQGIM